MAKVFVYEFCFEAKKCWGKMGGEKLNIKAKSASHVESIHQGYVMKRNMEGKK